MRMSLQCQKAQKTRVPVYRDLNLAIESANIRSFVKRRKKSTVPIRKRV